VCASPELDLRAVTTVSGDTRLRARIAARILSLGGRGHVPVAAGLRDPSSGGSTFRWLGHEGAGMIDGTECIADTGAVGLTIDLLRREPLDVVAIGPLTNIAAAIARAPDVATRIRRLIVMGGRLAAGDDAYPTVDYNLESDADAAIAVLSAGIPTTLVPYGVTRRVVLRSRELRRLRERRSALVAMLCEAIEHWAAITPRSPGVSVDHDALALLHDPLTVAAVRDRSLLGWDRRRLRPERAADRLELAEDANADELELAVSVDAERAVESVIAPLLALG
jgi:purine nucleosidase